MSEKQPTLMCGTVRPNDIVKSLEGMQKTTLGVQVLGHGMTFLGFVVIFGRYSCFAATYLVTGGQAPLRL